MIVSSFNKYINGKAMINYSSQLSKLYHRKNKFSLRLPLQKDSYFFLIKHIYKNS